MSTPTETSSPPGSARPSLGLDARFRLPPPSPRFVLAVLATSVAGAGFAVLLRGLLDATTALTLGDAHVVDAFRAAPPWVRVLGPPIGAVIGALVARWAERLPPSRGVGAVMEAVVIGHTHLSVRASLAKALSSFAAIAGGGSLGREGPLIQVGGALGQLLGTRLGLSVGEVRLLVAAGTASGFACAYNTPLAAALFVAEIVTGTVTLELVVPVLVAAAIGTGISRFTLGEGPFYGARSFVLSEPVHVALAIALGPIGGLLGAGFVSLLAGAERLFARVSHPVARAGLGGAIVGLVALVLPEVVGNGAEPIREMLDGRVALVALVLLLVAKPLATSASVGSGSAGGVFTPTMFLGTAAGGLLGVLVLGSDPSHEPVVGALALVGMASVISATTHAPLMASVLAFEMSGDYALVVPLLAASALATVTSRQLGLDSVYVSEARRHHGEPPSDEAERRADAARSR